MIMYMAIRYEGTDTFDLEIVDNINTSGPNYGKLSLYCNGILLILRMRGNVPNNRIQELQGNRNPFIDEPMYAYQIWAPMPFKSDEYYSRDRFHR